MLCPEDKSRFVCPDTDPSTVIDEADEMLESDWEEEFKKIMSGGGK